MRLTERSQIPLLSWRRQACRSLYLKGRLRLLLLRSWSLTRQKALRHPLSLRAQSHFASHPEEEGWPFRISKNAVGKDRRSRTARGRGTCAWRASLESDISASPGRVRQQGLVGGLDGGERRRDKSRKNWIDAVGLSSGRGSPRQEADL